ncbi:hypothetical protein HPB47_025245 [Ixodes persulcatus]|uniref:Uncharacterized protein n=1 Tax=Ixodes persulcatus TaxID=34615 RepID=A0AC60Q2J8_IXOPE|nr:hypothetical protein HPB47_025245 [Ixodes persulcatus]
MTADTSFTEFVDFALGTDRFPHQSEGESLPVSRRGFRILLKAMEMFKDSEFLVRYCFTEATVTGLLKFLSLKGCENRRSLPLPPMLQLLVVLQYYSAGTFRCSVTGDLANVPQPAVCRFFWAIVATHRQHFVSPIRPLDYLG